MDCIRAVRTFIETHWREAQRFHPDNDGTLIGLPAPYTVPCRRDTFQELYYWDTYFTCLGLWHLGEKEAVHANLKNFLFELRQFGFIPNGNRTYYLNRSQPPYFAPLVQLVRDSITDPIGIKEIVDGLETEHRFWSTQRATPCELSRHGHHATKTELLEFYSQVAERAQLANGDETVRLSESAHTLAEAETGWDFTPRFQHRCLDFCPVDLNSTLFILETTLAELTDEAKRTHWQILAERRRSLVQKLCWNESAQAFFDYDWVNHSHSPVLAASALHPLWAGLATPEQATAAVETVLPQLECAYGISACAPHRGNRQCQWDYPTLWPCLQVIACRGLLRYGHREAARRIAHKYLDCVCQSFERTGDLWEKYDACTGIAQMEHSADYPAPAMMGWTAGAFLDCAQLLEETAT